jgi:hypothetical protein
MALIKPYNPLKKNLLLLLHVFCTLTPKLSIYWIQNLDWLFSKYRNCSLKFLICLTPGFYRNFCLPSLFACVCVCTALAFFFNSCYKATLFCNGISGLIRGGQFSSILLSQSPKLGVAILI